MVAENAAQLFLEGWAPLLIFSGGYGPITRKIWNEPEAEKFAKIAIEMGVPEEKIIIENKSTNTGENVQFTKSLLRAKGIDPKKFILVQKPYMERRTYATFKKIWPEKEFIVTSPRIPFKEYLESYSNSELNKAEMIDIMIGDLQRIKEYPAMGFQIPQEIPSDVSKAYNRLIDLGFTSHLINR